MDLSDSLIEEIENPTKLTSALITPFREFMIVQVRVKQTGSSFFKNALEVMGNQVTPDVLARIKEVKQLSNHFGAVELDRSQLPESISFEREILYSYNKSLILYGLSLTPALRTQRISQKYLDPAKQAIYVHPDSIQGLNFIFPGA